MHYMFQYKFFRSLLRWCWYFCAALILFLALMVTIARIITPLLNQHRADFENWASHLLNQPVHIGQMSAWFEGFSPELRLRDVSILNQQKTKKLVHVNELQVTVSVLDSLINKKIETSQIHIIGSHFIVHQLGDHSFQVHGIEQQESKSGSLQVNELMDWLFSRTALTLSNIHLDFYTKEKKFLPLNFLFLKLANAHHRHQMIGELQLVKAQTPSSVQFNLLMLGDPQQFSKNTMQLYLYLKDVQLANWLKDHALYSYHVTKGLFNGKIWLNWESGTLQRCQSIFNVKHLKVIKDAKNPLIIDFLNGNVAWFRTQPSDWRLVFQFNPLDMQKWQDIPGVKNLTGTVDVESHQGAFFIKSNHVQFNFGKLFSKPLSFQKFEAQGNWQQRFDQHWVITAPSVSAYNDQVALKGAVGLLLSPDFKHPILSLLGGFHIDDTAVVKQYSPIGIFHQDLIEWLNHAFVAGPGAEGTVIIRGPLKDFPFDRSEGTFVVDSHVHDVDFHFAPGWPNLKHVNAHLVFHNRQMLCDASSGDAKGVHLINAHAEIPVLGRKETNETLLLDANLQGDAQNYLQYLHHSPLEESFGEDLNLLHMSGDPTLKLHLKVPLMTPANTEANGQLNFKKALLKIPLWDLSAQNVQGQVMFDNHRIWSNQLTANFLNNPIQFNLNTAQDAKGKPFTRVQVDGRTDIKDLIAHLHWHAIDYITGNTQYHATVDLMTAKGDKRQNLLTVQSNLKGITVNLPQPLGKNAEKTMPFSMRLWLGAHLPPRTMIVYGRHLSAALNYERFDHQIKLLSTVLHIGSGLASFQKEPGIFITGNLKTLDWNYWRQFFQKIKQKLAQDKNYLFEQGFQDQLKEINLNISQLQWQGLQFLNTQVIYKKIRDGWRLSLNGPKIDGYISIPTHYKELGLTGIFNKLYLQKSSKKQSAQESKVDPKTFPPISLQVDHLKYNNQYYGNVTLLTKPIANRLRISKLTIHSALLNGEMTGSWKKMSNGLYASQLSGQLYSQNLMQLFKQWKIHSGLIAKTARSEFNLNWIGPIYSPQLKNLTGKLFVKLGKGYIIQAGQGATLKLNLGRLLTLLNINRFLMMNFSDLTEPGYGFDQMTGHFNLRSGVVSTKDLTFDGSIAKILASGSINLHGKLIDLDLTITPYLTSSLPVVATIAGGPIIGAVTWLANKIVGKEVDKITTYYYHVTGTWEKPIIKQRKP